MKTAVEKLTPFQRMVRDLTLTGSISVRESGTKTDALASARQMIEDHGNRLNISLHRILGLITHAEILKGIELAFEETKRRLADIQCHDIASISRQSARFAAVCVPNRRETVGL